MWTHFCHIALCAEPNFLFFYFFFSCLKKKNEKIDCKVTPPKKWAKTLLKKNSCVLNCSVSTKKAKSIALNFCGKNSWDKLFFFCLSIRPICFFCFFFCFFFNFQKSYNFFFCFVQMIASHIITLLRCPPRMNKCQKLLLFHNFINFRGILLLTCFDIYVSCFWKLLIFFPDQQKSPKIMTSSFNVLCPVNNDEDVILDRGCTIPNAIL